jgi:hypothetical protein
MKLLWGIRFSWEAYLLLNVVWTYYIVFLTWAQSICLSCHQFHFSQLQEMWNEKEPRDYFKLVDVLITPPINHLVSSLHHNNTYYITHHSTILMCICIWPVVTFFCFNNARVSTIASYHKHASRTGYTNELPTTVKQQCKVFKINYITV